MLQDLTNLLQRVLPYTNHAKVTQIGYQNDVFCVSGLTHFDGEERIFLFEHPARGLSSHKQMEARKLVEDIEQEFLNFLKKSAAVFPGITDYSKHIEIEHNPINGTSRFSLSVFGKDVFLGDYKTLEEATKIWTRNLTTLSRHSDNGLLELWQISTQNTSFPMLACSAKDAILRFAAFSGWLEDKKSCPLLYWDENIRVEKIENIEAQHQEMTNILLQAFEKNEAQRSND